MKKHDIVVIGGGPAGMAAAVAAYDNGCTDVVILDREPQLGGILRQCIHTGFGLHRFGEELAGPEYAAIYGRQVKERKIRVYQETVATDLLPDGTVTARSREGILKLQAKAVILAMGCRERSRGALNICGSRPAGIYTAGTTQKLMNMEGCLVGKRVVILGSGDIGLIMARRMTLEGAKVEAVCEILPYSCGLTRNMVQCLDDFDIPLYLSTTVTRIHGTGRLEAVTISQVDEQRSPVAGTQRVIPCDTLLLSVGLIPENELTRSAGIPLDPVTNGAIVDQNCMTGVPGIFACGNVLQVHDLVDYVSEEAERAGIGAANYVKQRAVSGKALQTKAGAGVRYVLPQQICGDAEEVSLFLRVQQPGEHVRLVVSSGDRVLKTEKRIRVMPGEMERVKLPGELLRSAEPHMPITVRLEGEA